jgi:predicted Zn-dependent peptidase
LKKEYARRFRPERALLVVVGDVDVAAVKAAVASAFGGWKVAGTGAPATPAGPAPGTRKIVLVDRPGSVQSQIVVGRPAPKATEPDYYAAVVANTIFGGSFGSRLTKNVREDKGYTYSPSAQVSAREQVGVLRTRADVRNDVTAATLMEIFYELDRMGTTAPSSEELTTAKRYQSGLYLLRNQIEGAVSGSLANNWINGLPPEALGEFVSKINAVSAADVRRAGRQIFPSATQLVVVVGDAAKVRADVEQFGAVTEAKP